MKTSRSSAMPSLWTVCFEPKTSNVIRSPNFVNLMRDSKCSAMCFEALHLAWLGHAIRNTDSCKRYAKRWVIVGASRFSVPLLARRQSRSAMPASSCSSSSTDSNSFLVAWIRPSRPRRIIKTPIWASSSKASASSSAGEGLGAYTVCVFCCGIYMGLRRRPMMMEPLELPREVCFGPVGPGPTGVTFWSAKL